MLSPTSTTNSAYWLAQEPFIPSYAPWKRDDLIRGIWAKRKRVYELTENGERNIEAILNANDKIKSLMTNLRAREAHNGLVYSAYHAQKGPFEI